MTHGKIIPKKGNEWCGGALLSEGTKGVKPINLHLIFLYFINVSMQN